MRKKIKLSSKLAGGFGIVLLLLIAVGVIGYAYLGKVHTVVADLSETHMPLLQAAAEIDSALAGQELAITKYTIYRQEKYLAEYHQLDKVVDRALAKLQKVVAADQELVERGWLKHIKAIATQHDALVVSPGRALIKALKANQPQEVWSPLADKVSLGAVEVMKLIDTFLKDNNREAERVANAAKDTVGLADTIIITVGLGALLAGILLAYFITRSITKPIKRTVEELTIGAQQVAEASGQVASSGQSLAEGSSEQAASLEETSSSLEELSSMTTQNAENAHQADALMKEAGQIVQKANESMEKLREAMDKIDAASDETAKIIKTIDEIAFQTNLLALNAAVEAARAGEAGAGFAVVADEVRSLALRAAEAAKNTASLIETNIQDIKQGSDLVTATGEAFNEVRESVGKVGELVAEIAAASQEQSQGIDQINQAATQMDKVTQQIAANAEESAAASEELSAQAETMLGQVGELKVLVEGSAGQGPRTLKRVTKGGKAPARLLPEPQKGDSTPKESAQPEKVIPLDQDEGDFQDF